MSFQALEFKCNMDLHKPFFTLELRYIRIGCICSQKLNNLNHTALYFLLTQVTITMFFLNE